MQHQVQQNRFIVNKDQCLYYKKEGHYKKDCTKFLKMIMANKGENIFTFINESLYVQYSKSTWWIDSGATVHVANSLQGFLRRGLCKEVKDTLKSRMQSKQISKLLAIFLYN
jgi:hypothetical protein